jgi:ATP-binding cassette subfamily C protein LapB
MLGGRAIAPIGQLANLMSRYHGAKGAWKTLSGIMDKPVERPAHTQFLHRPSLKGKIEFKKASFSYPGTNRKVLDDVSFTIQPGEKVGLIGRIGSGKSTIARLMMGLYDPSEGAILYDDTDYRQIDPADLRRNMAYIAQDVVLFAGTVRDNLTASVPHAGEAEILAASKASGVHEFISAHPMGYDAPVGERGEGLSGGQRQCIALARAMLLGPSMYVCDEPTNAMDVQAENTFTKHVQQQSADKTLILITHRQHLLSLVNRLILIDQGKVVMDGPRDKVIEALSQGGIEVPKK